MSVGSLDRVRDTLKVSLSVAAVFGAVLMVVFMSVPDVLVGLFVSMDTPAAHIAVGGFPYLASGFIFFVVNLAVVGYFQSVERVLPATVFALLRGFIFLVPSFLILPELLGTEGIWLALPLSETLTTMTILSFYITTGYRRQ